MTWRWPSPAARSPGPTAWPRGFSSSTRPRKLERAAASLLGKTLVTYQTGAVGQAISKVLVTVGHNIARELYLGLAIDRNLKCPVLMASTEGGVEIETVAAKTPEKIHREPIDVGVGLADFQARKVCKALGLTGPTAKKGAAFLKNFVKLFIDKDASLAEINPLIVTEAATSWRSTASSTSTTTRSFATPTWRQCSTSPRKTRPSCGPRVPGSPTSAWTATSPAWSTVRGWP